MRKLKKLIALCLSAAMILTSIPAGTAMGAAKEPEIVAGGYEIDMADLPKVHFAEHPEWEELYNAAWDSHKSNIRKARTVLNPEDVYYVDEAFSDMIFAWDTLLMMMFDKYGMHQFPTLQAMDNFYYCQTDNPGQPDDGFIAREISEITAENASYNGGYDHPKSVNPPLWAWAEWQQYQIHGDKTRFSKDIKGKTVLERIVSHFDFIKRTRTMEENGLYGKTSGLANGLDNTPNQDWSAKEQTYNDLSIQQAQSAYYIAKIAHEIGDTETEARFQKEYEDISALINEKLWSEEGQFYFNLDKDQQFTNVPTPTGLWALSGHVATPERAEAMIRNYAQNSEKMFRPQGLSTTTYDWPTFKTTGGYWNGAFWAPTSFQYIKGLEYYGYDELAFAEAVRHVEALSDVYEAGKTDSVVGRPTLWENYSSEYPRQGDPARGNFVGWTGALGIGAIIEDILGVNLRGPDNAIDWSLRLTEENGISDLYMCHNGEPVRASLAMAERANSEAPADITVTASHAFTLHVKNGDVETTIEVPVGTSTYHIDGVEAEEAYLDAAAHPFRTDDASLTKEALDANAADYVVFGAEKNEAIDDGLLYQAGKNAGLIKNVNTVGYRADSNQSPVTLSGSAELEALGFSGAKSLTKETYSDGQEGFMFTVPATSNSQTVKLIVGVRNTTGTLTAALSDASAPRVSRAMYGGDEEQTYVVEIPYCAGGDKDRQLLVEFEAERASKGQGSVSIKGIVLQDGGSKLPPAVQNVSIKSGNGTITVSADNSDVYDSYNVYVSSDKVNLTEVYTTDSLPYVIENLENYQRYYVAVSGVKAGKEGPMSEILSEVPEQTPRTERERAYADYEAVRDEILNGNKGFDALRKALNFNVTGPVYGTTFTFTSTMNGRETGLMDNGSVLCPTAPQPNQSGELTIVATCGGETVKIIEDVTVLSLSYEEQPYVYGEMYNAMNTTVDLTAEGTKDWAQFNADEVDNYARKNTENTITGLRRLAEGGVDHAVDMPMDFTATDAKDNGPTSKTCITSRGPEGQAGFEFKLPYSEKMQHVNLYVSSWNATTSVEILVNGSTLYSASYGGSNGWDVRKISLNYKLPEPDDEILVRQILVKSNTGGSGGSIGLPAVTLAETDGEIPVPTNDYAVGSIESVSGKTVDLTAEGTTDWAQFPTKLVDDYAKKNTENVITNFRRLVPDSTPLAVDVAKDMQLNFTASDAAEGTQPKNKWAITCRGPEGQAGFAFNLPTADTIQHVNIYAGSWKGACEVQLLIGGKVRYSTTYGVASGWEVNKIGIDYYAENPDMPVEVRLVMNKSLASSGTAGSIALGAVTLADTGKEPPTPDEPEIIDHDFNIAFTNTLPNAINLTEEGGKDWMLFHSVDGEPTYQRKDVEPSIKDFTIFDDAKAPHRVENKEYNTVYSFTDGTPNKEMSNQKPYLVVEDKDNGVSFTLPGGANRQQAKITIGNWNADMVVEMTSGDKTASYEYQVHAPVQYGMFTLNYKCDEDVQVRIYNKAVTYTRYGNFSLTAILLNEIHSISAEETEGGSVKLTRSSASTGETVDVFTNPQPNYHLKSLAYRMADGTTVAIENNRFVMPNADVTVVAEFERQARLLIAGYSAGVDLTVTTDADAIVDTAGLYAARVLAGDPLTFAFTPVGAESSIVGVHVNDEAVAYKPDGFTYTYTMPDEDANLRFSFDLVNKSILAQTIAIAEELVEGDEYANAVESVQKKITNALKDAKDVYQDVNATQKAVNSAWSDLIDALHYLSFEKGDLTELKNLIDLAEEVNIDEFTAETVAVFEKALEAAKDVYDDGNDALAVDVEKAWQDLRNAMDALVRIADKSGLNAVIAKANATMEEIDKFVDGSEETLRKAIDAAQAVMDDATASQKKVDNATEALIKVLAELRKIPSREELLELLAELEQLDLSKYTAASAAAMQAQTNLLRATVENPYASSADRAAAYYGAKDAQANLKPIGKPSNSKASSASAASSNAYGAAGIVAAGQNVVTASVRSDTTVDFTLKRGSAYCFKMTVVNSNAAPSFTVGNGNVLKTQFVAKIGNDYYYRVYAVGTPGQSTGIYTTLPGQQPQKHCAVTIA